MAVVGILLLIAFLPLVAATFSYSYGENKTIYPRCFNASSGAFYGSNANLTVRNETGIYYIVDDLENVGPGLFKHHVHNLSLDRCYVFDLGCEDPGAWRNEWGVVCVNSSTLAGLHTLNQGVADLGGVFGSVIGVFLFVGIAFLVRKTYPVLLYFLIPISGVMLLVGANIALKGAEAAAAGSSAISAINILFGFVVTVLVLLFTGTVAAALIKIIMWFRLKNDGGLR